ncbi:MAG: hypothetical protein M3O30_08425 [Planctomycetota bacterium]|nr:hypothetical protein [Planctomycetota bacterium]
MSRINDPTESASTTTDQLKDKATQVGQNIRDMGGQLRDAATEQYGQLRDQAGEYYEQGRRQAREWEDSIEHYVHEKPVQSLLIAAGVGLILGMIWRRD